MDEVWELAAQEALKAPLRDVIKSSTPLIDHVYESVDAERIGSPSLMFVPVIPASPIRAKSSARAPDLPKIAAA